MRTCRLLRVNPPQAGLVREKPVEALPVPGGDAALLQRAGFKIPTDIPAHSWIRRKIGPPSNRYHIKPGRHWRARAACAFLVFPAEIPPRAPAPRRRARCRQTFTLSVCPSVCPSVSAGTGWTGAMALSSRCSRCRTRRRRGSGTCGSGSRRSTSDEGARRGGRGRAGSGRTAWLEAGAEGSDESSNSSSRPCGVEAGAILRRPAVFNSFHQPRRATLVV